jgi:hypothetical protein
MDNVSQSPRDAAGVTLDDMNAALKHLGWESVADLHYWSKGGDIQRFETLCNTFAAHRAQAEQRGHAQGAAERAEVVAELEEQARIVGAGGERELALMAEVGRLRAEVARLSQDLEGLQFVASVVDDPDRKLCCDGRHCGCQGATVGQYAAWVFEARTALQPVNSTALAGLIADTADHPEPSRVHEADEQED